MLKNQSELKGLIKDINLVMKKEAKITKELKDACKVIEYQIENNPNYDEEDIENLCSIFDSIEGCTEYLTEKKGSWSMFLEILELDLELNAIIKHEYAAELFQMVGLNLEDYENEDASERQFVAGLKKYIQSKIDYVDSMSDLLKLEPLNTLMKKQKELQTLIKKHSKGKVKHEKQYLYIMTDKKFDNEHNCDTASAMDLNGNVYKIIWYKEEDGKSFDDRFLVWSV